MGALDRVGMETTPDMSDGGQILPVKEVGMADGGAAFKYPSSGKRPERLNKSRDVNPAQLLRGWAAGTLGLPGDIEGIVRFLRNVRPEGGQTVEPESFLPTSEFFQEYLPGRDESPAGQALSSIGSLAGGLGATKVAGALERGSRAAGKALAPKVGEMAERYMHSTGMAPTVVKPKGGNWLTGSVERQTEPMKNKGVAVMPLNEEEVAEFARQGYTQFNPESGTYTKPNAVDNWIDQKLNKYIKNEMGTPEDPIRLQADKWAIEEKPKLLAEKQKQIDKATDDMEKARAARGFTPEMMTRSQARIRELEKEKELIQAQQGLHFDPLELAPSRYKNAYMARQRTGMPTEGMGQSDLAHKWETLVDASLEPFPAKAYKRGALDPALLEANPWLQKVEDEAMVFSPKGLRYEAGFEHLIDELRNATRANSDLPAHLRLSSESLNKLTVPQASAHVDKINAWRSVQKAEADKLRATNPATFTHKEYPEAGMRWVELRSPDMPEGWTAPERYSIVSPVPGSSTLAIWDNEARQYITTGLKSEEQAVKHLHNTINKQALEDALKYEGEVMGHCVGGYCPDVESGKSRIYSLRDKKGEPHVTIEIEPNPNPYPINATEFSKLPSAERAQYQEHVRQWRRKNPQIIGELTDDQIVQALKEAGVPPKPDNIVQIKGKQNRAPKEEYLPFVQDFVRGGKWSEVRDIQNTGLIPIDPKSDLAAAFSKLGKPIPSHVTQDELTNLLKWHRGESELPQGFAQGGFVQDTDALVQRLVATGMSQEDAMKQALRMAGAKEEAHMAGGGLLSKFKTIGNYKALPLQLPRAPAKTTQEIADIAERVGRQQVGEHVRKPKKTENLAGRSAKEVQKLQQTQYTLEPTKTPALEAVVPEKAGEIRIALPGDISVADKILMDIEGLPIGSVQEGGPMYGAGKTNLADPRFWASGPGPAQIFQNKVTDLANVYQTPEILAQHMAMGHEGMNFAQHLADANLLAIQASMPHPKAVEAFNKVIREGFPDINPETGKKIWVSFPDFPGVENYEQAYKATQANPELRKWFNDRMKKSTITEPLNFPDGKKIEYAIMEPALRNMEIGMTGLSVGKMKPGAELVPGSAHRTYSHDILGTYMGKTPELIPVELAFPDAFEHIKMTKSPAAVTPTIQKLFPHQIVDEQYINQLGEYYDKLRKVRGFKEGGAVAPEGGEEFAKQVMQKMAGGGLLKAMTKAAPKAAKVAEVVEEADIPKWAGDLSKKQYEAKLAAQAEENKRLSEIYKKILQKEDPWKAELPPGVERVYEPTRFPISYVKSKDMTPEEFAKKDAEEIARWRKIGDLWKQTLQKPLEPWSPPQQTKSAPRVMEDLPPGLTYEQLRVMKENALKSQR